MTSDGADCQAVFEALADPDCRTILGVLDEPRSAKEVVAACDLLQTSTYRKLDRLSEADLVDERVEIRSDGNHATTYVRNCTGVLVAIEEGEEFDVDLLRGEGADDRTPDERLARLWSRVSEEL
ncbi:MAG: helix-turn-helix domain-containing protein [Haloferacaceae archaeon]